MPGYAAQRELDLLLPAEYSEERAEGFPFSEATECCFDFAALVGGASRTNVCIMMITTGSREYG